MPKPEITSDVVRDALRDIEDPEIGTNIVDLGLIYDVSIDVDRAVIVKMTTTTRFCPASAFLADAVKTRVESLEGGSQITVELVYEPAWSPEMAELFSFGSSTK
jgi:metal-sulfur cluster biosynthetic enzyme